MVRLPFQTWRICIFPAADESRSHSLTSSPFNLLASCLSPQCTVQTDKSTTKVTTLKSRLSRETLFTFLHHRVIQNKGEKDTEAG